MDNANDFELDFCDKCFQMTNHVDGKCMKCESSVDRMTEAGSRADYMIVSKSLKEMFQEFEGQPTGESQIYEIKRKLEEGLIELEKRYTTKTDGDGNVMVVDNPDYQSEDGSFRKHRRKNTGYTPPKKKRKKNKKTHRRN